MPQALGGQYRISSSAAVFVGDITFSMSKGTIPDPQETTATTLATLPVTIRPQQSTPWQLLVVNLGAFLLQVTNEFGTRWHPAHVADLYDGVNAPPTGLRIHWIDPSPPVAPATHTCDLLLTWAALPDLIDASGYPLVGLS